MFLRQRQLVPELMDDPHLNADDHDRALRGLSRLNRISGSAALVWHALRDLAPGPDAAPLRVLDVATGGGDVPRRLRMRGTQLHVDGCDCSTTAVEHARTTDGDRPDGRVFVLDALQDLVPAGYDVIVCSLFLHHLETQDAVHLIRRLAEAAGRRLVVNDLERSAVNLGLVTLGTRLVTRSRIVHTDGPRSVRAAFTLSEMRNLARQAGIAEATVARRFPCRLLLTWNRP